MSHGIRRPEHVLDLRRAGLGGVEASAGGVAIGATTTYAELASDPLVRERAPALAVMAAGVTGGAQVRNQGTIGGSACYASPSSDVPGALVGLSARLRIASSAGTREVDAAEFFRDAFSPDLAGDELLTAVVVPDLPAGARSGYVKLKLCESSWPIATACCMVELEDGAIRGGRIAIGGVDRTPYVVDLGALGGKTVDDALAEVGELAEKGSTSPYEDVLASADYRRQVAGVVARRSLAAATQEGSR
jgi:CO/xanthine dehydrogenase FAD-binding subunit